MNPLLLVLVLTAAPLASAEPPPASVDAPRVAIWLQPLGTVFEMMESTIYLSAGTNLPLSETVGLGLELTVVQGPMRSSGFWSSRRNKTYTTPVGDFWRLQAVAGPTFSLHGKHLSGPFIQPKLMAQLAYEPDHGYVDTITQAAVAHRGGKSLEMQLGLDVGWHFASRGFYFAPVLGASVGRCFNCAAEGGESWTFSRLLHPEAYGYSPQRKAMPVVGINFNLLRMGASF